MNHKWQGRAVALPEDAKKLEAEAADNELGPQKMPRTQAEDAAYAKYKQEQHTQAAGHHLRNLRVAVAHGDKEDAARHNALYTMHMQALGLNPHHPPPAGVHEVANKPMTEKGHRFTNHRGDNLLMGAPMNKAAREYLGSYRLAKGYEMPTSQRDRVRPFRATAPLAPMGPSNGPGGGDDDQASGGSDDSASGSSADPEPTASVDQAKATVKTGHSHDDAGPQHYDKGSVVVYNNASHDNYVPPSWIGTIKAHHLLKIHSANSPGHKHFYELVWRTPEGRMVEDFLSQDEIAPYRKNHG
jgi:hypothetical protein